MAPPTFNSAGRIYLINAFLQQFAVNLHYGLERHYMHLFYSTDAAFCQNAVMMPSKFQLQSPLAVLFL